MPDWYLATARRRSHGPTPFRPDGIRGVPGTPPLDEATLAAIGEALGKYQDFLTLWKNPDPGLRILKEAKAEYAKLQ